MNQEHAAASHQSHDDYTFNASALGLGGVLQQGRRKTVIPSQASVALSPTGGEGSALVENFERNGITFTRAESRVAGYASRDTYYTTYSDILITNLSVFDRFTVSLMHLTVASSRDTRNDEANFSLHAMYRGVQVDGDEVIPELDLDMCTNSDYKQLASQIAATLPPDQPHHPVHGGIARREPIRSSVIRSLEIRPHDPNCRIEQRRGNLLVIEGFARVYFGELLVKPGRRRVNLLRFELMPRSFEADHLEAVPTEELQQFESHVATHGDGGGTLTVGSGDGNGAPVWPNG